MKFQLPSFTRLKNKARLLIDDESGAGTANDGLSYPQIHSDSDIASIGGSISENTREDRTNLNPISAQLQPDNYSTPHGVQGPASGEGRRLVIGIDFGTTYSGVSYALVLPGENPEAVKVKQVRWLSIFGDDNPNLGGKIPSTIGLEKNKSWSVNQEGRKFNGEMRWGFDKNPEGYDVFQWMKILLEPVDTSGYQDSPHVQRTKELLRKHGITAVELVTEYLKLLWNAAKDEIRDCLPQAFDTAEKTIVLSVPAGWSEQATQNTYVAAAAAFAGQGIDCRRDLKLINEPAAAAVHVLTREKKDDPNLIKRDDCVIVCDAGGGTVDVVTFKVTGVNPHLVLEEVVAPKGGLCGSIYLDKAFEPVLASMIGQRKPPNGDPSVDDVENAREEVMKQFKREVKIQFGADPSNSGSSSRVFTTRFYPSIQDPRNPNLKISELRLTLYASSLYYLCLLSSTLPPSLPQFSRSDPKLRLSWLVSETLRAIFEPVCHQVYFLIQNQIEMLERLGLRHKLKVVVLVGGFGHSKYLRQFLTEQLTKKGSSALLKIMANGEGIASVAKGAVLAEAIGITRIFNIFVARHNIGLGACQKYVPGIHDEMYRFAHSITGEDSAHTVVWFLEMGSQIRHSKTKEIGFILFMDEAMILSENREILVTPHLVLCDEGRPRHPEADVKGFVSVEFHLNKQQVLHSPSLRKLTKKNSTTSYYQLEYSLVIKWGIANLEFSCKIDNRVVVDQPSTVSYGD
ncbi:hypothetical protein TWF506_008259 [Arthrobotrys conoides]|uniref:Uncharacterized protein n=1 Tax=Arthrobotrys conoides TaxID=74498 RepID=A0AAN8NE80_9PEZI